MNADDVQLLPTLAEEVNGINLYAYCGNNPVMAVDPEGSTFHDLNDAVSYIYNVSNGCIHYFGNGKKYWPKFT